MLNTPSKTQITDAIAEQLLHDLVATPSPSHHEADASQLLVEWMQNHGYDRAFVDEAGNAVGIIGQGEREIVLLGHIDTFGGTPPVKIDGRKLYGRGSVDAKGSLCTFAAAAAQANLPADVRVVVIGAVEEEAASSKGARFAVTQYQPQMCIIGEPSNWDRITLGYKGRLLLDWRWNGALAHSAGQAASPAEIAFAYWQHVQNTVAQINEGKTRIFERLDVTLQNINTGQDGAYGWSQMIIGFRLPPGIDPHTLADQFCRDTAVPCPPSENVWAEAEIRPYGMEVAFVGEKDTPLSRAFRGAIRAEGGTPAFVHKTGTADMNIVGPVWGCPIVAYGPGDSALDHTPDEHIDLDEYLHAVRVLSRVLANL